MVFSVFLETAIKKQIFIIFYVLLVFFFFEKNPNLFCLLFHKIFNNRNRRGSYFSKNRY